MPQLSDGTYVPAFYGLATTQEASQSVERAFFSNNQLHLGYVVAAYPPKHKKYPQEDEWTYDIVADVSQDGSTTNTQLFQRARLGMGGSTKDFMRQTIKAPNSWDMGEALTPAIRAEATRVYFTCEDGLASRPVILAFARHEDIAYLDDPKLGHNLRWDFNGISTTISKDGEYAVTFLGSILDPNTNSYIEPPAETTGTTMVFQKDGSWLIDDVKGESIKLDKAGKGITVQARKMSTGTTEGNYDVTSKGKTTFLATGNAVFNSKAKIYIGKEGATDPLVLGNKLAEALKALVDIISVPIIAQAGPLACSSYIAAPLKAWASIYGRKNVSPFLSKKGFVS